MPEASTGPGGDGRLLSFTVTKSAQGWSAASSPQGLEENPCEPPGVEGHPGLSPPGLSAGHCLPSRKPTWYQQRESMVLRPFQYVC